jgi:hypothetical protein
MDTGDTLVVMGRRRQRFRQVPAAGGNPVATIPIPAIQRIPGHARASQTWRRALSDPYRTFHAQRSAQPRHRAAPWPTAVVSAMAAVLRARLLQTRFRITAAAVAGGLAAAPLAVWATLVMAQGEPPPAAANTGLPAPALPSPSAMRAVQAPHATQHASPHRRHAPVSETAPVTASGTGRESATAPGTSSGSGPGAPNWQASAAQAGAPSWALKIASSYVRPGR